MSRSWKKRALDVALSEEQIEQLREEARVWAEEQVRQGLHEGLSEEALRFIYVMCHPFTGDTAVGWAEIAGVDRKLYSRHRHKTGWKRVVDRLRDERRPSHLLVADRIVEELATDPTVDPRVRLAAARTIYEREGAFVKRVETTRADLTPAERERRRRMVERLQRERDQRQQDTTTASPEQQRVLN